MQPLSAFDSSRGANSTACNSHPMQSVFICPYRCRSHRQSWPPKAASCRFPVKMMASGGEQGGSFNPFRNKKKEDAAKKALQEMFQGKQDMLAAYDAGGGGSGKGGKGGKGGGDGEGSGGFNWREWSAKFLRDLGGGAKSAAQTVAALLLLLSIFYAATFVRPLSAAALNAVRYILRLDGRGARRGRASVPATAGVGSEGSGVLGSNERSIISKYGADNDAEDAGEDDEGEDGEDAAP